MKQNSRISLAIALRLLLVLMCATCCAAASPTRDDIEAKVTRQVSYTIDQPAQYDIVGGEALRIDVQANPYGVAEMLIYANVEREVLTVCAFDAAGETIVWNGRPLGVIKRADRPPAKVVGSIDQLGSSPCAALSSWRVEDNVFHLSFIISTDKARNREAYERALIALDKPEMTGSSTRNSDFMLPPRVPLDERLTGFIRFWTEAKHNFPFFSRMPELNWDKVLVEYLPRVRKAETLQEYNKVMLSLAALLKDGHTNYYPHGNRNYYCPPIRVIGTGGKAIIQQVDLNDSSLDAQSRDALMNTNLRPGEEITSVDGLPVNEHLEKNVYPYVCASTPQGRDVSAFYKLLQGEPGSRLSLSVKRLDGSTCGLKLTRCTAFPPSEKNDFVFRKISDDVGYVNLPTFGGSSTADQFDKLADQMKGLKGLIIDVRRNGGGDSGVGHRIISRLIDSPLKDTIWKTRDYRPAFRAWGRNEGWHHGEPEEVKPAEKKYFLGPIVLLTSPETFSAAEDFTAVLHFGKRVTIVGEKTGGSTGQPLMIALPMGASARICTKWDTYPDGREFVGVGIIPDVEIGPTAEDIATGRDAVLEKGVTVLKGLMAASAK